LFMKTSLKTFRFLNDIAKHLTRWEKQKIEKKGNLCVFSLASGILRSQPGVM